jgi:hypothetical protein
MTSTLPAQAFLKQIARPAHRPLAETADAINERAASASRASGRISSPCVPCDAGHGERVVRLALASLVPHKTSFLNKIRSSLAWNTVPASHLPLAFVMRESGVDCYI